MMNYQSTRGSKNHLSSAQAIIRGIAEDKGLYVPEEIPALPFELTELSDKTYQEVAFHIIKAFFGDYTDEELHRCVDGAYDSKFDAKDIVPVVAAGDGYFMELYHGRTAAFKDMALSILPYLLTTALHKEKEDKKIVILTATSGDTGKAALEGFADVPGTEIIVFYPSQGVSLVQERQMTTQEGKNTHVYAIDGNFDDAQAGVKKIFNDPEFATELATMGCKLSSANSINIGRLVPQVAYYVYGYGKLVAQGVIKAGDPINVVVPTGNFGNILAAYYAGQMGLPINRYICASNENNVLTDFINTGIYDLHREFYLTNSPSMDILISSNLERLLFLLSGNDGKLVRDLMDRMETEKSYEVTPAMRLGMASFYGGFADMKTTGETIGQMYHKNGYLMDTHTAVAYRVYQDYREQTGDTMPTLIASTASAYKFADSVADAIGIGRGEDGFESVRAIAEETGVPIPTGLQGLSDKPILHNNVVKAIHMDDAVKTALSRR